MNQKGGCKNGAYKNQNTTQSRNASFVDLAVFQRFVQQIFLHGQLNQRWHPEHHDNECEEKGQHDFGYLQFTTFYGLFSLLVL